ncbi:MAG: histone deacetylase [Saprospiraceae bacterium]|nr:histone deacetylase [Saprospiraceae bacterium]
MKIIYNDIFLKHDTGHHPENKERLRAFKNLESSDIIDGRPYLELVHNGQYIADVEMKCKLGISLDMDTLCSEHSFIAATTAVGATIQASQTGDFALVRPPGHHSYPGKGTGFCIFNNIAIAVQNLVNQGKRVLIIDFDGHFGDGTSSIFYDTDKVLFLSMHQFPAFPGTGHPSAIGKGAGEGFNINIPVPPGSGDDLFIDAIQTFLPVAKQFKPDVVAVSAGFDSHKSDMLLDLRVSVDSYYRIGQIISQNFSNVFAVLEGGYVPEVLVKGVENFIAGINKEPKIHSEKIGDTDIKIMDTYEHYSNSLILKLRNYWNI